VAGSDIKKPPSAVGLFDVKKPPSAVGLFDVKKPPSAVGLFDVKKPPSAVGLFDVKKPPSAVFFALKWKLFDFGFFVDDVLADLRVEFSDFDFLGVQAFVFRRGVEMSGAGR
jgi:hypothetical protein